VVVLRVDAVEGEIGVGGGERVFVRMLAVDERAARGFAVDDDVEGVVVEICARPWSSMVHSQPSVLQTR